MICYFVDGLCGSAKTYAAIRYAHRLAKLGKKIIIVQPSIFLIDQTCGDLGNLKPEVRFRAIHGGTSERVVADIIGHAKQTAPDGEILLVTHSALTLLPYFHRKHDWHIIMDEIPQCDWCAEFNVSDTHKLITDCFAVDTEAASLADNRYVRATPKDHAKLERMARNKRGDQVWSVFQQLAVVLLSPHWSAYVLHDRSTNLVAGDGENRKLLTFAHLKPSLLDGFASATVMGACFRQSMLYELWQRMGVQFRPHKPITKGLRYIHHENGKLLTIRYATDADWSKNFRDKLINSDCPLTVQDRVVRRVAEVLNGCKFVWLGNKDVPDNVFEGRGLRLPNSPYGLNPYQHIHHAVILSALNPPPAHFSFLDALGFDSREVKQAGYWQAVYQSAMRISLRVPDDTKPKTVIVMDHSTADWLADMFPGCAVVPLGELDDVPSKGKPGRPRKHDCDADRKRALRDRFKVELQVALDLVNGGDRAARHSSQFVAELRVRMSEFCHGENQRLSTMGRSDLDAMGGTVYASIYHSEPLDFFPLDDIEAFIEGLRFFHAESYESKEMNGLISPAIFDPALSEDTNRGLANIRAIWGLWFDNDHGDLTHEEFARLFPRLRLVIFNSYSSTRVKPRWRVFVPTTIAMPIAAYRAIGEQIMRTVNRAGYWSLKQLEADPRIKSRRTHGFDIGKLTPSSLFYLPCQAKNPTDSFFTDNNSPTRLPLDPYLWAGYAANHFRPSPEPSEAVIPTVVRPMQQPMPPTSCPKLRRMRELLAEEDAAKFRDDRMPRQAAAIDRWRIASPGAGHQAFFQLGVDLRGTGMTLTEIDSILRQEAGYGRHPAERRAQIGSIIRTLAGSSRRSGA